LHSRIQSYILRNFSDAVTSVDATPEYQEEEEDGEVLRDNLEPDEITTTNCATLVQWRFERFRVEQRPIVDKKTALSRLCHGLQKDHWDKFLDKSEYAEFARNAKDTNRRVANRLTTYFDQEVYEDDGLSELWMIIPYTSLSKNDGGVYEATGTAIHLGKYKVGSGRRFACSSVFATELSCWQGVLHGDRYLQADWRNGLVLYARG